MNEDYRLITEKISEDKYQQRIDCNGTKELVKDFLSENSSMAPSVREIARQHLNDFKKSPNLTMRFTYIRK